MSLEQQQELESQYVMHTFARKPVELVSGKGMEVEDAEGNTYLDFIAGIGVCSLGHCHPVITKALQDQSQRLIHVSNYYYIEGRGELSRKISGLLNGGDPASPEPWQTFYANSGAEANECAIKLARLYARKNAEEAARAAGADDAKIKQAFDGAPRTIVVLDRSFHGRTLATLAATAQPAKQEAFQPLPGGFVSTPINDVQALTRLFEQQGHDICAVMLECVQGEGGVWPATYDYLRAVSDLCHEKGILLVIDEVQTGFFRCGAPFSFQRAGIEPDVVSMAKGIADGFPMGAVAARAEVADLMRPGDHGSTFGGSALAMAACRATLCALVEEDMGEHVIATGKHLRHRLEAMPHVTEVRGRGLMRGAQLDVPVATALVDEGLAEGLVLNHIGDSILRFLPPLCITDEQVDEGMDRLEALLAKH